jgi:hypothetical protein
MILGPGAINEEASDCFRNCFVGISRRGSVISAQIYIERFLSGVNQWSLFTIHTQQEIPFKSSDTQR